MQPLRYFSTFTGIGGFEVGISNAFATARILQGINNNAGTAIDIGRSVPAKPLLVGYSEVDTECTRCDKEGRGKYQPQTLTSKTTTTCDTCGKERFQPSLSVFEQQISKARDYEGVKNYGDITKINASELPDFECLVGGFPCQAFSVAGKRRGFEDTRGTLFFDLARILKAKTPRLFVFENVKGLLNHDGGNTFKTIIAAIDELGYDCQWQVLNSKDFGVPQNRERIIIVGHLRGTTRPEVFPIIEGDRNHIEEITRSVPQAQRVYSNSGISPSLDTAEGGNRQPKVIAKTVRTGGIGSPFDSKQNWDSYIIDGGIRRLTPLECERLQAFPDGWTEKGLDDQSMSDNQRYKMLGNAVTTNVIQAVFEKIYASL